VGITPAGNIPLAQGNAMSLDSLARTAYNEDHEAFRQTVRRFMQEEIAPHQAEWAEAGIVPKAIWPKAGELGLLCPTVPEAYGGLGLDFGYNAIVDEETAYYGGVTTGFSLQSDIVSNYIIAHGSEEQKREWLPKLVSGEVITAIAMTEPGTGSDLQGMRTTAKKDGNHYVINGSKTYITNGQNADLILVCCKTDNEVQPAWKGVSIVLVEANREGFKRGRNLDKIGQDEADTSELFFEDVRVPITNCLGEEGQGFIYLMSELPQERLSIAVSAQASAQKAFDMTVEYTRDRKAFGKPILDFQNSRFVLADLKTKLQVGWAHLDWALTRHLSKELTPEEGAAAKLWHTELQWEMMDKCLQLFGGAGYMNEYPIARMWRGARVTRIFGGTSEIMKELIGRKL
jgi:acyl-CoA dehydrogenase